MDRVKMYFHDVPFKSVGLSGFRLSSGAGADLPLAAVSAADPLWLLDPLGLGIEHLGNLLSSVDIFLLAKS
ncbi:hypothetical protein [Paeniglutamicibacter sulfureus]